MKREVVLFSFLVMLLVFNISFIIAEEDSTEDKITKAYTCLSDLVEEKNCSTLSISEQIFSLLSIRECKDEILESSSEDNCWPSSNCNLQTTAQAVLALSDAGSNTEDAEDWLFSKNNTVLELDWFLQIDGEGEITCSVKYGEATYTNIIINEDKTINPDSFGPCLTLSEEDYWLKITPICYDEEFEISCAQDFMTNLLYQKSLSPIYYVSDKTNSAAADGITREKIESSCFGKTTSCDYVGSLWSTFVLDSLGHDMSSYMPYLITMAEENERYLPDALLYFLGNTEFRASLLSKQKSDGYWEESGDKFYDTALAAYPFQGEEITEIQTAKEWLLEKQEVNGCWDSNNVLNTGFILYSIWPEYFTGRGDDDDGGNEPVDCDDVAGGFCMSSNSCLDAGGSELDYDCSAGYVCCDTEIVAGTCEDEGGEECAYDEECSLSYLGASDSFYCCPFGYCAEYDSDDDDDNDDNGNEYDCVSEGGVCETSDCESGYEIDYYYTCSGGDICCMEETNLPISKTFIWILIGLIILVVLGIVFKDNLQMLLFKLSSGSKKPKTGGPRHGFPPSRPLPMRRPIPRSAPRRIVPPTQPRRIPLRKSKPKAPGELDYVLKKLKEMGK